MRDDTEMNVATLDVEQATGLRMMLLAEHVGLMGEEDLLTVSRHLGGQRQAQSADQRAVTLIQQFLATIDDPLIGLRMMIECAQDNLRRFKAKQPLVGHLLPYLTAEEAKQHGLHFREAHGWVELADCPFGRHPRYLSTDSSSMSGSRRVSCPLEASGLRNQREI
jgi:hypothetical protein